MLFDISVLPKRSRALRSHQLPYVIVCAFSNIHCVIDGDENGFNFVAFKWEVGEARL